MVCSPFVFDLAYLQISIVFSIFSPIVVIVVIEDRVSSSGRNIQVDELFLLISIGINLREILLKDLVDTFNRVSLLLFNDL
jgi:hypothetical protein